MQAEAQIRVRNRNICSSQKVHAKRLRATPMQALETATTNLSLFLGLSKTWAVSSAATPPT